LEARGRLHLREEAASSEMTHLWGFLTNKESVSRLACVCKIEARRSQIALPEKGRNAFLNWTNV
jgi:hypothetical protein